MSLFGVYWADPWFFLGLLILPLLLARLFTLGGQGRLRVPSTAPFQGARRGLIALFWWLPGALRIAAITALVLAVARPQVESQQALEGEGVDVMIALDMSSSMDAVDMSAGALQKILDAGNTPDNRFEGARKILKNFIMSREQDRIGLVIFGPEAWLKYPLTVDYARLIATLDGLILDTGVRDRRTGKCLNGCTISGSGTAIGDAMGRAYNRVRRSDAETSVILLITDGKQEAGTLDPLALARHIRSLPEKERPLVFTFLVGSEDQVWVPERDFRGQLARNANGSPVYTQPSHPRTADPDLLRQIADLTGGQFYASENQDKMREDMAALEKTLFKSEVHTTRNDVFPPFLWAAFFLFMSEQLLRLTRFRGVA